uniref:Sodium/calcium exchanger membrane region domain-containing protein n=1 Tax=Kalanchoe fedtschenkoi TaxID=63787 RepID=A0A7N0T3A6_KALFE
MASSQQHAITTNEPWLLENGSVKRLTKEARHRHGRSAHSMSSSSLRKKSDLALVNRVRFPLLRLFLANLQEVILGTKLFILFPAVPLAVIGNYAGFGRSWVFALSLIGLTPLAERVSFLTEQIAMFTGPTVGGLLNATCGNATELIIAIFALAENKIAVVKYSLLGSVLSNLLLVLGTSLFCGGIANMRSEQRYDRKQADVNSLMLLLGLLCHMLPLMFKYAGSPASMALDASLNLSRASCIVMLIAYVVYIIFQLFTHRQLFEEQDDGEGGDNSDEEEAVIGFGSGLAWLIGMTAVIALLSEFVVGTIEDGTSHYLKGLILLLCYIIIAVCFFFNKTPSGN